MQGFERNVEINDRCHRSNQLYTVLECSKFFRLDMLSLLRLVIHHRESERWPLDLPTPEDSDGSIPKNSKNSSGTSPSNGGLHEHHSSAAWNGFLRLSLPEDVLLDVLQRLSSDVMPYLSTPLTLSDFLTSALDRGGGCGLLALKGIFVLMTQHNLEYPDFYKRVYGLLTDDVFLRRDRATFLHLLDNFLKSGAEATIQI